MRPLPPRRARVSTRCPVNVNLRRAIKIQLGDPVVLFTLPGHPAPGHALLRPKEVRLARVPEAHAALPDNPRGSDQVPSTRQGGKGGVGMKALGPLSLHSALPQIPPAWAATSSSPGSLAGRGQARNKWALEWHVVAMGREVDGFLCPFSAAKPDQSR